MTNEISRAKSLMIVVVAYAVCLAIGWLSLMHLPVSSIILKTFLADVTATLVIYFFSLAFRNSSLYDPYWSVIPIFIVMYWISLSAEPFSVKNNLLLVAVSFWGIRLTANWCRGWTGLAHQDWRYGMLQQQNPKLYWLTNLGGIHLFPTVAVYLGLIPAYFIVVESAAPGFLFYLGAVICFKATIIEWAADQQMWNFKKTATRETNMERGLWAFSRHPNYFGEIGFWLGIFVMGLGIAPQFYWSGIGFIAILSMFLFASIPMMEKRSLQSKPGFASYQKRVAVLVPWKWLLRRRF